MKKFGFTLAEVLITLGIIGVVAAMTMPSLIANHQKRQTIVQLKKVYSDLSNAVKLSENDNGPLDGWTYRSPSCSGVVCADEFITKYHQPYFQGSKIIHNDDLPEDYSMLIVNSTKFIPAYLLLNNGVLLGYFINMDVQNLGYFWWFADVNGFKGPNKMGRDIFVFSPTTYAYAKANVHFWNSYLNDVNELMTQGRYACNADNTDQYKNFNCGRVIELSGWKIPDGYPW